MAARRSALTPAAKITPRPGEPAAVEGGEKALSLSGARAGSQAEVDDFLLAIGSLTSTVTRTRPSAVTREIDEIDAQPET